MQLSAPPLSIDPSVGSAAEAAGFQTGGAKGNNPSSYAAEGFGAMLAAESRNKAGAPSSPRSKRQPPAEKSTVSSDRQQALRDLSTGGRGSSLDESEKAEPPVVPDETLAAAAGVVVTTPPATVREPVDAELDVTLPNAFQPAEAAKPDGTLESDGSSSSSSRVGQGRPMLEAMLNQKSQALSHAFGLTSGGSAVQNSGNAQAIAVARVPATSATAAVAPGSLSGQALPTQRAAAAQILPMPDAVEGGSAETATSQSSELASFANVSAISRPSSDSEGKSSDSVIVEEASAEQPSVELSDEAGTSSSSPDHALEREATIGGEAPDLSANGDDRGADLQRVAASSAIAEKIAAHRSRAAERLSLTDKTTQRILGVSDSKDVTTSYARIGINAAKFEAHMPATAPSQAPASLAMENSSLQVNPLSLDSLIKEGAGETTSGQVAFAARRAVEAVLSIADQAASTDQRSVKLQFTVGDQELAVRVELRGERVHTTFRTDSPDLRIALAHEWQSVSAVQSGVRTQRLADPVFASTSSSGNGMSSDSGATHQRDSSARQPHATAEELFGSRRAVFNTPPAAAAATTLTAVVAPSSSLRLQTFA